MRFVLYQIQVLRDVAFLLDDLPQELSVYPKARLGGQSLS